MYVWFFFSRNAHCIKESETAQSYQHKHPLDAKRRKTSQLVVVHRIGQSVFTKKLVELGHTTPQSPCHFLWKKIDPQTKGQKIITKSALRPLPEQRDKQTNPFKLLSDKVSTIVQVSFSISCWKGVTVMQNKLSFLSLPGKRTAILWPNFLLNFPKKISSALTNGGFSRFLSAHGSHYGWNRWGKRHLAFVQLVPGSAPHQFCTQKRKRNIANDIELL